MSNKTINQFNTVTSLSLRDVVLGYSVGTSTTVQIPVSNIVNLTTVDTSGFLTDAKFPNNGYMKRTGLGTYTTVSVIPSSDITGLSGVATTGTLDSLTDVSVLSPATGTFLKYSGTEWVAASVPSGGAVNLVDLVGITAYGASLCSAGTAASAGTLLNLGTLATTSTAASAQSFIGITSYGMSLASAGAAVSARGLLGFEVSSTVDNIVVFSGATGGTKSSVVTVESAGSIYGYLSKLDVISGSSYTVVSSDTGRVKSVTAAVTCSVTLTNAMQPGFNVTFLQKGTGVIQFTAGTSATIEQRQSFVKSAGQYAAVGLVVSENSNGTAAHYLLSGDMA